MSRRTLRTTFLIQLMLLAAAACSVEEPPAEPTERYVPRGARSAAEESSFVLEIESTPAEPSPAVTPAADVEPVEADVDVETTDPLADLPEGVDAASAGREAWESGAYGQAAAYLAHAAENGEAAPYDVYLLGLALWRSGELERAESALVEASWKMESFARAPLNLARVRLDRGDTAGAAEAIEAALAANPELPGAHNVHGRVLLASGDREGAAEAFRRAAELDPADPWPLNNLGYSFLIAGDAAAAIAPLEQAVDLDPAHAAAWHNLALSREQLGDIVGALQAAEQAATERTDREAYRQTATRLAELVPGAATDGVATADLELDATTDNEADTTTELAHAH